MTAAAKKSTRFEDTPLWQMADEITEHVYAKLSDMPEEERWDTTAKLRSSANQLIFAVAIALGDTAPAGREYDWAQINKQLFALKTMYRFAGRQHFFQIDPDIMLKLDEMVRLVAVETAKAVSETHEANEHEFAALKARLKEQ